jgi:ketosteroid isomerase-like protein
MDLYAAESVFMPPHSSPSVGAKAVRAAYQRGFEAMHLQLEFSIDEIHQLSPRWTLARTHCAGTSRDRTTRKTSKESNQELVLFQLVAGRWKIARCCLSTTLPRKSAGNGGEPTG